MNLEQLYIQIYVYVFVVFYLYRSINTYYKEI